jgi:hypothetical protein
MELASHTSHRAPDPAPVDDPSPPAVPDHNPS